MKLHNPFANDNAIPPSVPIFATFVIVFLTLILLQLPSVKMLLFVIIIAGTLYMLVRVLYFIFRGK